VAARPGAAGQIRVTAVKYAEGADPAQTEIEAVQAEDGAVHIRTLHLGEAAGLAPRGRVCRVDYTLLVPPACDLHVHCVSSSADLQGLSGALRLDMVSGPIQLQELDGELEVHSVSGDGAGRGLSGRLKLHTVSGNFILAACRLASLEASTVSGDLALETRLSDGPYQVSSVSGALQLRVPPETGCEVEMTTLSGDLSIGLSAIYHEHRREKRRVTVQDGGPLVSFHSLSGDLALVAEPAAVPGPAHEPPQTPMAVLERIARGEITVDEGIALLEQ
jgi:hypothetical protein